MTVSLNPRLSEAVKRQFSDSREDWSFTAVSPITLAFSNHLQQTFLVLLDKLLETSTRTPTVLCVRLKVGILWLISGEDSSSSRLMFKFKASASPEQKFVRNQNRPRNFCQIFSPFEMLPLCRPIDL